jgi:hypothetical protein
MKGWDITPLLFTAILPLGDMACKYQICIETVYGCLAMEQ